MELVTSREYKVMLDHWMFFDPKAGLREIQRELKRVAKSLEIHAEGKLDKVDRRTIRFLDTPDTTIRRNGMILRIRRDAESAGLGAFTLKCRTPDRYVAAGRKLQPAAGLEWTAKFEEDIVAPFTSRFSQSVTVDSQAKRLPDRVATVAEIFPVLGQLRCDGRRCDAQTRLSVVGDLVAHERVYRGMEFTFPPKTKASMAVILWANSWKGPITCAELSFRYGHDDEKYAVATAEKAFALFAAIQKCNWCVPDSPSKTQVAYGGQL